MKHETLEQLFLYAVRVLGARACSESVLRQKLARHARPEVVAEVLQRVKSLGYLDDQKYAEGYARLYAGRWGPAKLRRALLEKGVARSIVDQVLAEQESQNDPVEEAMALLDRYQSRHRGEKPRVMRFLLNRGYAMDDAYRAWEGYHKQKAAEAES
jgi:regulatory protein